MNENTCFSQKHVIGTLHSTASKLLELFNGNITSYLSHTHTAPKTSSCHYKNQKSLI